MLRPEKDIHKCLISSPARLIGEYEDSEILIAHAFPSMNDSILRLKQREENPFSRYYYVCVFKINPPESDPGVTVPDYSHIGTMLSIILSVFYGKRFDNHGVIESHGGFSMPLLNEVSSVMKYYYIGSNNNQPRKDLDIDLKLKNIEPMIDLFYRPIDRLSQTFLTAGKFYLSSLQSVDYDLEKAFLDLVTCGEILSNYFEYPPEEIYDNQLKEMLIRLELIGVAKKDIQLITERLYQVKAKFKLTFLKLLNKHFFDKTESRDKSGKITRENIEACIKKVYDLRSEYVHSGISFGDWLKPGHNMNEIRREKPFVDKELAKTLQKEIKTLQNEMKTLQNEDKELAKTLQKKLELAETLKKDRELAKILHKVPTYIGLERMVRFALLRFLHIQGIYIHPELEHDKDE